MKRYLLLFPIFLSLVTTAEAQSRMVASVLDSATGKPIAGANVLVEGTTIGGTTGIDGTVVVPGIPDGWHTVVFSSVGYLKRSSRLRFPLSVDTVVATLIESNVTMEGVTVTSARTSYHLYDAPVRIEVKGEDDIRETMIDHPSSISELFLESTGIQVLRTSAVSNYVSVKMQGLDGSYTQILKDGFPLYGGLSSGLSVTQIPPLDLKRVEIIKGPSSSLYGGGAIAGLINLISKTPDPKGETTILLNGESDRGIDAGLFYSRQYDDRLGVTLTLNGNSHSAYDADGSGFSDVPKKTSYVINPKIFYSPSDNTRIMLGLSTGFEDLEGGDMTALGSGASSEHPYLEKNKSDRTYTQLELNSTLGGISVTLKNSLGYFSLNNSLESLGFSGTQWTSYTELTLQSHTVEHTLTGGLNATSDRFTENHPTYGPDRSYSRWTVGMFGQDDWRIAPPFTVETGLRIDKPKGYGLQVLSRIGAVYRLSEEVGLRASAGMGYKIPTIFSDQSDPYAVYQILPTSGNMVPEKSVGGEVDVTYNAILFEELSLSIDQAFFYTRVNHPFALLPVSARLFLSMINADGYLSSRGTETDVKLTYADLQAYIGYTYTDAENSSAGYQGELYLTPRNRFVTDIAYDLEGFGEAGIELRYTGPQLLHGGSRSPGYWIMDLLLEKSYHDFTFFVAAENFFNYKQANYAPVFSGSVDNPEFADVWAPLEGRVVNAGIRIDLK